MATHFNQMRQRASCLFALVVLTICINNSVSFAPIKNGISRSGTSTNNRVTTPSAFLTAITPTEQQQHRPHNHESFSSTTALNVWGRDDEIDGADRLRACVPYILPLQDGDQFGRYIYMRIPPLQFVDQILLGPLLHIYHAVPFLGLIFFVLLSLGTRNTNMSRAVRFNAQQAVLIDVLLIFPQILGSSLDGQNIPRYILEPSSNFVYYTYMAMIIYCVYSNLRGKKPNQIPFVSEADELVVGPF